MAKPQMTLQIYNKKAEPQSDSANIFCVNDFGGGTLKMHGIAL